ncbi:hypothetical protein BCR43DRAFT_483703 [Syncephalastrum racemosum]|uniref:C2H2-type domain-containing protein n=1 Tax=Syncephalastrum racemosum TaxID=13706 RepID=A0A1X2HVK9_SYNRA|nr:hypothetical protein BCR43DRAFT_483703 [Syncephalastrum racemosum]
MFSQQKQPAFKFVIKSKITDSTPPPLDDPSAEVPPLPVLSPKQEPLPSSTLPSSSSASSSSPPPPPPHTKQDKPASPPPAEMGDRKRKRTDKEPTTLATKKVHGQLQKWNQKSAELKTAVAAEDEEEALKSSDLEEDEFADLDLMACLLCQRKFKSRQDLQRHQDLSELHKKNLADPACIDKARMKKRFARTDAEKQSDQAAEVSYFTLVGTRKKRRRSFLLLWWFAGVLVMVVTDTCMRTRTPHTHIYTYICIYMYYIFHDMSKSLIVYSKTTGIGRLNGDKLMANQKNLHFPASLGIQRLASPSPRYLPKGNHSILVTRASIYLYDH